MGRSCGTVPVAPDLNAFPRQIGRWSQSSEISIEPEVQAQLRADRLLDRMYYSGTSAGLSCKPSCWSPGSIRRPKGSTAAFASGMLPVRLVAGIDQHGPHRDAGRAVAATQYIVSKGGFRSAVLYWYQTRAAPSPGNGKPSRGFWWTRCATPHGCRPGANRGSIVQRSRQACDGRRRGFRAHGVSGVAERIGVVERAMPKCSRRFTREKSFGRRAQAAEHERQPALQGAGGGCRRLNEIVRGRRGSLPTRRCAWRDISAPRPNSG